MRNIWILGLLILLTSQTCGTSSPSDLDIHQVKERLQYLIKHQELSELLMVDSVGISIYASLEDQKKGIVECRVTYQEAKAFAGAFRKMPLEEAIAFYAQKDTNRLDEKALKKYAKGFPKRFSYDPIDRKPLRGLRVAIDPGHMGGNQKMAEMEGRIIKAITKEGDTLIFNEGNLALQTALILQARLTSLGAKVFLTREKEGHTSFGCDYPTWIKDHRIKHIDAEVKAGRLDQSNAKSLQKITEEHKLFKAFFRTHDLRNRAVVINEFNPHMTLIIHYNADPGPWMGRDANGYISPMDENYSMVFVPGAFMKGELAKTELRALFMRNLVAPDWEESVKFSGMVQQEFEQTLGVPAVEKVKQLSYMDASSILTKEDGVYARNLTLTRMINGPLCYGECFCQDNLNEAIALAKQDTTVEGILTSKRVADVADAYFNGIMSYAKTLK